MGSRSSKHDAMIWMAAAKRGIRRTTHLVHSQFGGPLLVRTETLDVRIRRFPQAQSPLDVLPLSEVIEEVAYAQIASCRDRGCCGD
jgi:hypothetical protein